MALSAPDLELGNALLDCLTVALQEHPVPPANYCLRVGEEVRQDLSIFEDECCDGLAYVKVNQSYPSANFPEPLEDPTNCATNEYALDLEMGIFRCAPTGDEQHVATCEQWTSTAEIVAYDHAAMRRAVACFRGARGPGEYALQRAWVPLGPQGGCTGSTMVLTASFTC